jgi:hypothetical protein
MSLTIAFGQPASMTLEGHSAVNGALIPDTAIVALTSNDVNVATVPATVPVPAGGSNTVEMGPITVLGPGSTDIHVVVTLTDGTKFEDTATLIVGPAPVPGLAKVTLVLHSP